MTNKLIDNKLYTSINQNVPTSPGVYLWKNSSGEVVYVGKAINLRKRMKQYFEGHTNSWLTPIMMEVICDYDFIIAKSERDAFALELNQIKKYNPIYNIKLREKRNYPYFVFKIQKNELDIKILSEIKDKTKYDYKFGPLTPNTQYSDFLDILINYFLYSEGLKIINQDNTYWNNKLDLIKNIFTFKDDWFYKELQKREIWFSDNMNFEWALKYKKGLNFLDKIKETQITEISNMQILHFFAFEKYNDKVFISIRFYQNGSLIFVEHINKEWKGIISDFIEQYLNNFYLNTNYNPNKILIDCIYKDNELMFNDYINSKIFYPQKGILKQIIDNLNEQNHSILMIKNKYMNKNNLNNIWIDIQNFLNLNSLNRIFIFDNSFINNKKELCGVVDVYDQTGYVRKMSKVNNLEKYKLNMIKQSDVQFTYYNAACYLNSNILYKIKEDDIFIADGSIQQIKEIKEALKQFDLNNKVFGLVKNNYHKTDKLIDENGKQIKIDDITFKFLSSIQEKVDKRAKFYLNKNKNNNNNKSSLLKIKGIGKQTESKLLNYFKTFEKIKKAKFSEIELVVGKKFAKLIYDELNKEESN
ncbi:GIY-YIG nuclease family protein [Mycoplasmopsis felis]|uniref:GIY-YIG nuclease family protein n=1 Tax=Mycoplasmopsis felis TaxID=33923 RepID=UPI002B003880|nr:GIY-YIG nuclease family protein [Mycoplasmopsis felis]WQQ10142.1 GIY-YIG nuclease family protein [Mycoplasmopsis felis]